MYNTIISIMMGYFASLESTLSCSLEQLKEQKNQTMSFFIWPLLSYKGWSFIYVKSIFQLYKLDFTKSSKSYFVSLSYIVFNRTLTIAFKLAFEESPELCNLMILSLSSCLIEVYVDKSLKIFELLLKSLHSAKLKPLT